MRKREEAEGRPAIDSTLQEEIAFSIGLATKPLQTKLSSFVDTARDLEIVHRTGSRFYRARTFAKDRTPFSINFEKRRRGGDPKLTFYMQGLVPYEGGLESAYIPNKERITAGFLNGTINSLTLNINSFAGETHELAAERMRGAQANQFGISGLQEGGLLEFLLQSVPDIVGKEGYGPVSIGVLHLADQEKTPQLWIYMGYGDWTYDTRRVFEFTPEGFKLVDSRNNGLKKYDPSLMADKPQWKRIGTPEGFGTLTKEIADLVPDLI